MPQEISSVHKGNQGKSLKTTIPQEVVQKLKLGPGDKILWDIGETKVEVSRLPLRPQK